MKLLAVDIETTGLNWKRDTITCVGMWDGAEGKVYRDLDEVSNALNAARQKGFKFIGHSFKFDIKFLMFNGVDIRWDDWAGDSYLLALANPKKIPKKWLDEYTREADALNAALPRGFNKHRKGSEHSLKTLAPYHLNVSKFWEDPDNHDNDDYVLKDCKYTLDLYRKLYMTTPRDVSRFAQQKLLPWTKTLAKAEMRGIKLDMDLLAKMKHEASTKSQAAYEKLVSEWSLHLEEWTAKQDVELMSRYVEMSHKAVAKLKDKSKTEKTKKRYLTSYEKARSKIEPFNFDSPAQLKWLLKDRLKLDVSRLDNGEESTGASVLENLAQGKVKGAEYLLEYRKARKLATAFFPSYEEMHHGGIIHTNFNIGGTRTGRLSSSSPNLQQVPGNLRRLFVSRPGYKLLTFDESAIEARLIAYVTRDPILTSICLKNQSIHDYNTKYIFFPEECEKIEVEEIKKRVPALRKISKTVGFALFYGAGHKRIHYAAKQAGMDWTEEYSRQVLDRFKMEYDTVFTEKLKYDAALSARPYMVNLLGRPFTIEPKHIYMTGFNTYIQSSASHLVLKAASDAQVQYEQKNLDAHVLLLIHDEIVVEAREDQAQTSAAILKRCMIDFDLEDINLVAEGSVNAFWDKG